MACLSFMINDFGLYKALTTPRHEDILFQMFYYFTFHMQAYDLSYFREGYEVGIEVLGRPPHPVWIAS